MVAAIAPPFTPSASTEELFLRALREYAGPAVTPTTVRTLICSAAAELLNSEEPGMLADPAYRHLEVAAFHRTSAYLAEEAHGTDGPTADALGHAVQLIHCLRLGVTPRLS